MRGTVMRVRDGGASYFVLIDGDDKVVLRNKKFLRSINESDLTEEAPGVGLGIWEEDHVTETEQHFPRPAKIGAHEDAMMDCESSSANACGAPCWRSNEAVGEQRVACKPTRRNREQTSSAATRAQASPECHRLAGGKSPHTSSDSPTKRVTRSKGKKLRFDLRNNQVFEYYYGRGPIK